MHGPKQPYGVRRWRLTECPCRGDSHEYSNKWSATMGLPSGGLGYGPCLSDGPSAEHCISWLGGDELRVLNPSEKNGSVRSGRWCRTLSGRNPGRCLSQIYRSGSGGWENYGARHSGWAPEISEAPILVGAI